MLPNELSSSSDASSQSKEDLFSHAHEFEELVRGWFSRNWEKVIDVSGQGEQGADFIAKSGDVTAAVQVKCNSRSTRKSAVRQAAKGRKSYNTDHGILVCSRDVIPQARREALELNIKIVSGSDLMPKLTLDEQEKFREIDRLSVSRAEAISKLKNSRKRKY